LTNDALHRIVKEFVAQCKWEHSGDAMQKKVVAIKDIKKDLSSMASEIGIKCISS